MSDFDYKSEMSKVAKNLGDAEKARQLKKEIFDEISDVLELYEDSLSAETSVNEGVRAGYFEDVGYYRIIKRYGASYTIWSQEEGGKPTSVGSSHWGKICFEEDGKTVKSFNIGVGGYEYVHKIQGACGRLYAKYDADTEGYAKFICYDDDDKRDIFSIERDGTVTFYDAGEVTGMVYPDNTQEFYSYVSLSGEKHIVDKERNIDIVSKEDGRKLWRLGKRDIIHYRRGVINTVYDCVEHSTTYYKNGQKDRKVTDVAKIFYNNNREDRVKLLAGGAEGKCLSETFWAFKNMDGDVGYESVTYIEASNPDKALRIDGVRKNGEKFRVYPMESDGHYERVVIKENGEILNKGFLSETEVWKQVAKVDKIISEAQKGLKSKQMPYLDNSIRR